MDEAVTVYRMDFDAKAFERLQKIAAGEGVPLDRASVIRWAAMQFLRVREAAETEPAGAGK